MSLFKNDTKKFLENEKRNMEEYMAKLGPGEEYDKYFESWKKVNEELEKMSLGYKISKAFPWIALGVTAAGTIFVPLYGMNKAYKEEEEENHIKNGTVFTLASKQIRSTNGTNNQQKN